MKGDQMRGSGMRRLEIHLDGDPPGAWLDPHEEIRRLRQQNDEMKTRLKQIQIVLEPLQG